jgi:hypothetical protein
MIYNGIDLSEWDPRTQKLVKKHNDLSKERFDGWDDLYSGNMKAIELEYIRHIGMGVFGWGLHYNCSQYIKEDPAFAAVLDSKAIKEYKEAKRIFKLLEELDKTPTWNWGIIATDRIEMCDVAISRIQKLSTKSPTSNDH